MYLCIYFFTSLLSDVAWLFFGKSNCLEKEIFYLLFNTCMKCNWIFSSWMHRVLSSGNIGCGCYACLAVATQIPVTSLIGTWRAGLFFERDYNSITSLGIWSILSRLSQFPGTFFMYLEWLIHLSNLCWQPLWPEDNVAASHSASPGAIPILSVSW